MQAWVDAHPILFALFLLADFVVCWVLVIRVVTMAPSTGGAVSKKPGEEREDPVNVIR